jgi:regulator of protease activity HflC (stomatin/prohibitin superfamily)
MEWLSSFFYTVSEIIPRLLHITKDMRAVKLSGNNYVKLKPGYHVYWPLIHDVRTCYITRQEIDLPEQILVTSDGQSVMVSTSIVYKVKSVIKALIYTQDYENTAVEVAQRAVKQLVTSHSLLEVVGFDDENEDLLITLMQKNLNKYGLSVENAFFTSATKTRSYHFTGNNYYNE